VIPTRKTTRIAIVGGGISGTFTTKYLLDHVERHNQKTQQEQPTARTKQICQTLEVTLFEPRPVYQGPIRTTTGSKEEDEQYSAQGGHWQASRVQSLQIESKKDDDDPIIVELGASIGFREFHLVLEMIQSGNHLAKQDPTLAKDLHLELGPPFSTGSQKQDDREQANLRQGLGIYNGMGEWSLLLATYQDGSWQQTLALLYRYGRDLYKLDKLCKHILQQFALIPSLLDTPLNHDGSSSFAESYFPESPNDIWETIGLEKGVHASFDELLDSAGISKSIEDELRNYHSYPFYQRWYLRLRVWVFSLWNRLVGPAASSLTLFGFGPGSGGLLRGELLTAINLVNYNQDNSQVNGIVGMGSFAASSGGLFSIRGGNVKILKSALQQAYYVIQNQRERKEKEREDSQVCADSMSSLEEVQKRISTVLWNSEEHIFQLYAQDTKNENDSQVHVSLVGEYDIVILATAMQHSRIEFLIQSHMDYAVLQPMPLGGLVNPTVQATTEEEHEGHDMLPRGLPDSAKRPYMQVVTTVVSNATLSAEYFGLPSEDLFPRAILMTSDGKQNVYNITAISQITASSGVYKIFSNNNLPTEALDKLFGPNHVVEYVKMWGGPWGGATPDYRGQGTAANFLLYDGATGLDGHTNAGALYYTVAMEQSSLACMELAAIGAKAVSKLVARRLGLLKPAKTTTTIGSDEL